MLKVNNVKVPTIFSDADVLNCLSHTLRVKPSRIKSWELAKKSLDCRKRDDIKYVLSVLVQLDNESDYLRHNPKANEMLFVPYKSTIRELLADTKVNPLVRPIVVGSGPAGMFAALTLAIAGARPIVVERGKRVKERQADVKAFWQGGQLNPESNIQFGEGGAGTFSDGKLNTGIATEKIGMVLSELVEAGAPVNIKWDAKPHIGTDILAECVQNIRKRIEELGGEYLFETKLVDVKKRDGKLCGVTLRSDGQEYDLPCNVCVLAIGHSARDTFEMLSGRVMMEQKAFSIGVRIEHLQSNINRAQYGRDAKELGASDYKLAAHLDSGRSCYTFCMCPGGYVVAATSEQGGVVTNGMSYHDRDGVNANSALLVGVTPADFEGQNVLAGVEFQRKYERLAYAVSSSYKAPCQRVGDFISDKSTSKLGEVQPTYLPGVELSDLRACLPNYVVGGIKEAIGIFDSKIKGFGNEDALLTGVETRSSSPVRILRDEYGNSSVEGLIPCGEGAGYAGGITSACVDGINMALKAIRQL